METIAFFNLPAYGHIRPTLPVVEALVARGCRVVYFTDAVHREAVAATGAEVRVTPDILPPDALPERMAGYAATLAGFTARSLPFLLESVEREGVGLIVHDSVCPWGRYLAQLTGLPSVRTCGVLIGFDPAVRANVASMNWRWLISQFSVREWLAFRRQRRRLVREFGLKDVRMDSMVGARSRADRSIVFTSREFIPGSEVLDERTQFVGASFSHLGPSDFALPPDDGRPLVYISLGTTFTDAPAFFESCKKAFGAADAWVVMSLGRKVDAAALEPWPDNFRVAAYVPQLEILERASVFVTQAGGCSVMESLWHGVPLVMWPLTFEHEYNAGLVVGHGAGVQLAAGDLEAERLSAIALKVATGGSYRAAAERLGESFRAAGGPARAADFILEFHPAARPTAA